MFIHWNLERNKHYFIINYKDIAWQNETACMSFTYILSDRGAQFKYIFGIFDYTAYPDKQ